MRTDPHRVILVYSSLLAVLVGLGLPLRDRWLSREPTATPGGLEPFTRLLPGEPAQVSHTAFGRACMRALVNHGQGGNVNAYTCVLAGRRVALVGPDYWAEGAPVRVLGYEDMEE